MRKGDKREKEFSELLHRVHCPVLISSLLLRFHQAGQVDIAGLSKNNKEWLLNIYEIKSSLAPSYSQMQRLLRAQNYLSRILEMSVKLEVKFCQKDEP